MAYVCTEFMFPKRCVISERAWPKRTSCTHEVFLHRIKNEVKRRTTKWRIKRAAKTYSCQKLPIKSKTNARSVHTLSEEQNKQEDLSVGGESMYLCNKNQHNALFTLMF